MKNIINIDGRFIGSTEPPFVIAEMSGNHNGNIENAFKLIDAAADSGANAIKLQTYTADTLTIDCSSQDFKISKGLWAGKTLYQLYEWAHTPWEWHEALFDRAREKGITILSSPFDKSAVDLLENLGCPAYKIASFEVVDLELIQYTASTGKPLIISTGMACEEEISEAVLAAKKAGCEELALLYCVSAYPAQPSEFNLGTMNDMEDKFEVVVGLSDHTPDNLASIVATSMGASIIEKHLTLDRTGGGPDDSFSLEPKQMMRLSGDLRSVWEIKGSVNYGRTQGELENMVFRRSLYFITDLEEGEEITRDNVKSIRPGYGILPKYLDLILGKRVREKVYRGTPVSLNLIH